MLPNHADQPDKHDKSQATMYREKVREKDPEHYSEMKKTDKMRKRAEYKAVEFMNDDEIKDKREKWRQAKQTQRSKHAKEIKIQKTSQEPQDAVAPQHKRIKLMTSEERKEYNRQKKKESRNKRTKQKKTYDRQKDRDRKVTSEESHDTKQTRGNTGTSRATLFRKAKQIREQLPQSPKSYAATIDRVINPATPKKVAELEKRGVKRKLDESMTAITSSIQEEVKELRSKQMTENKRRQYKFLTHAACKATAKYPRMRRKIADLLGIGGKVLRNKRIIRKIRRDTLPQTTKDKVQRFWKSEDVSREVPLKKRVKKPQMVHQSTKSSS